MSAAVDCIPNIGPHEREMRIRVGVSFLAAGAILAAILLIMAVSRPWRLVVFFPLWIGAIGVFQAREKTCVALVARGQRNMDAGAEPVRDPAELEQLRAQARSVHVRSLVVAAVLSAIVVAAP
jgi:hypothetical protein